MDVPSTIRYTYAVVEFPDEGSCDVIPTSWLTKNNTHCRYPKLPSFKITKYVRNRIAPPKDLDDKRWEEHKVRVLLYTDSYEKGRTKANYAEYRSHVESETDNDRLRKSTKRVVPPPPTQSSSDDEIDVGVVQKRRRTTNSSAKRILFRDTHPFSEFSAPATPLIQTSSTERNQPSFRLAPGSGHLNSGLESPFHLSSVPNSPSTLQVVVNASNSTSTNVETVRGVETSQNRVVGTPVNGRATRSTLLSTPVSRFIVSPAPFLTRSPEKITKFQSTVLRALSVIQQDLKLLMQKCDFAGGVNAEGEPSVPVSLPLQTIDDFYLLNEWLANTNNRTGLINQLKLIGGGSVEGIVRGILLRVIGPTLNSSMNFSGKFNKVKLKGTLLHAVVLDTTRSNNLGKETTDNQIQVLIQKWLNGVNDRDGGRNKRRRNEIIANSSEERPFAVQDLDTIYN
ncbi:unnamed protein product [Orchesella dallaii]|uniref:DUF4806 domain-containing protein n=1 Tax=Orchesella dallaii TaxID=48710 RepID=A0ABP1RMI7_9HEXA